MGVFTSFTGTSLAHERTERLPFLQGSMLQFQGYYLAPVSPVARLSLSAHGSNSHTHWFVL